MTITVADTDLEIMTGAGPFTLNFTAVEGDFVACLVGHDEHFATPSGWTEQVAFPNDWWNLAFVKEMTASPDSSIALAPTFGNGEATLYVLRGVDLTTPEDVAETTAAGSASGADAPSITPVTDGALVIAFARATSAGSYVPAAPSGYSNFVDATRAGPGAGGTGTVTATKIVTPAAAEDPGSFGNSTSAWNSMTLAFRPAAAAGGGVGTIFMTPVIRSVRQFGGLLLPAAAIAAPTLHQVLHYGKTVI